MDTIMWAGRSLKTELDQYKRYVKKTEDLIRFFEDIEFENKITHFITRKKRRNESMLVLCNNLHRTMYLLESAWETVKANDIPYTVNFLKEEIRTPRFASKGIMKQIYKLVNHLEYCCGMPFKLDCQVNIMTVNKGTKDKLKGRTWDNLLVENGVNPEIIEEAKLRIRRE